MDTLNRNAALHDAVAALAARCDGARTQDGAGFSSLDAKFGKRVAAIAPAGWSEEIAAEVSRILPVYKRQLLGYGIDVDNLPLIRNVDVRTEARSQARKAGKKPYAEVSGGVVRVFNSFDIKESLKPAGFRWDGEFQAWKADLTARSARVLVDLAVKSEHETAIKAALTLTVAPPVVSAKPQVMYDKRADMIVIDTEFGVIPLDVIRALPGRKWDAVNRVNTCYPEMVVLEVADEYGLNVASIAREAIEGRAAKVAASSAVDTDAVVALADVMRPYQRAGVAYAVKHVRSINADDMGLGKTLQAIAAAETLGAFPVLVTCPASLRGNWIREIKRWLPGRSAAIMTDSVPDTDFIVTSYEGMTKAEGHSAELGLYAVGLQGLIFDEAHYLKEAGSARTIAAARLCASLDADNPIMMLTGTPVLSRPRELVQPLLMLGVLTEARGMPNSVSRFISRYCRDAASRGANGASNESELSRFLRASCMVRRTKDRVLTELPPKQRAPQWNTLTPAMRKIYDGMARDGLARARQTRAEAIVYINALREAAGYAKTLQAEWWAHNFLSTTGKQLVIFAHHQDIQKALILGLRDRGHNVTHILGTQKDVEDHKARFQSGESKVIVCSIKAGGVGHTLTAASDVLIVEQGWTPADHWQEEDRTHRIGQTASVTAWYLLAEDTIDEWSYNLIDGKARVVTAITDGGQVAPEDEAGQTNLLDAFLDAQTARYAA